jgi:hypothetical protein
LITSDERREFMAARKARQPTTTVDPKPVRRPVPRKTTVALAIHVVDPDSKRLHGIHVALKQGDKTVNEGFTDKRGEIEFEGLTPGEDYKLFVNDEETEELVGPRGDDEHEVEYDGEYTAGARPDETDDEEASAEADDEDDETDGEDDVDLLGDDEELEL